MDCKYQPKIRPGLYIMILIIAFWVGTLLAFTMERLKKIEDTVVRIEATLCSVGREINK